MPKSHQAHHEWSPERITRSAQTIGSAAEQRARAAGLDWPTVEALDDDTLEARLYGATVAERPRPLPDPSRPRLRHDS